MSIKHILISASVVALMLTSTTITSCSDDDDSPSYPNVVSDFVCAHTNADGYIKTITTDKGETYSVQQSIHAKTADSTYRCVSDYSIDHDGKLHLYDLKHIFSALPHTYSEEVAAIKHPLHIVSQWQVKGYINLALGIMTHDDGTHTFGFCEDSVTTDEGGTRTVHVSLLHKQPEGDIEAYTKRTYLSMPLTRYVGLYEHLSLSINTYDGIKTFKYDIEDK